MAVAFRAAGTLGTSTGGAATVVSYPAGVASGDLLLLQMIVPVSQTVTTPSGWTVVLGPVDTSTYGNRCYVFRKIAGGSEPSSVSVTISSGNGAGIMSAFTGVDGTTPIDVSASATTATGGSTPNLVSPSVTTTVASTLLVRMYWAHDGTAITPAGGTTEIYDANAPGQPAAIEAATIAQAAAGASGTTTATLNTNTFGGLAATLALAPEAAPPLNVPFISSATTVYAPTLSGSGSAALTVPNIASTTTLFTQSAAYAVPASFIAATGAVYAPTLVVSGTATVTAPNIPATTVVYTPVAAPFGTPFIAATTVVYAPSIRRSGIGVQPVGVNIGFDDHVTENAPTWNRLDA